jgi:hypothetical protein
VTDKQKGQAKQIFKVVALLLEIKKRRSGEPWESDLVRQKNMKACQPVDAFIGERVEQDTVEHAKDES